MLYSLRLLLFLINIDQTTVSNWFNINLNNETIFDTSQNVNSDDSIYKSIEYIKSLTNNLWEKVQDGLELTDIENVIFFLIFVRFIILIFRYNLKTSTYITFIGMFAGYLWYRHLIDLITMYSQALIKIPYLQKLGVNAIELEASSEALIDTDVTLGSEVHWYNPGKLLYYAFTKGIIQTEPDTGLQYYIDPISMAISNLSEKNQARVLPYYYNTYNIIIPRFLETVSEFWQQLSGVAAYAVITRIGKRYCPYLVRWHWTFLLIIGFLEQIVIFFLFRIMYFQQAVIEPKLVYTVVTQAAGNRTVSVNVPTDPGLLMQFNFLNVVLIFFIVLHLGSILFGLFHAVCGQYFYFPFLVENTELHIGPRTKNSVYSGGQTAWQDEKRVNAYERKFTKLWYGWFGSGTNENWVISPLKQFLITNIKKFLGLFKR
jgi:hypothetical protein